MVKPKQDEEIVEQNPVGAMVRRMENLYVFGNTVISKYVNFNLFDNINRIDAYLNSKHISGDKDASGRDKPFFNIVTAAANIWFRATDIDRKDIKIRATRSGQTVEAFIATLKLREWMRKEDFGVFLNDWGLSLARYGSSLIKFVNKNGRLHADVIPWNRLIVDSINIEANPIIEVLELTEAQLREREGYDQDIVEKLCDSLTARTTLDRQQKDNKADYIKIYEVHGNLKKSWLTGKPEDEDTFVQQMQVISFTAGKEKGEWNDFTLFSGKEENPYLLTHLLKEDGRSQSIGAVENLFEAQWMVNHSQKSIKDQLDLASKLIFQTSDGNFVGQNALQAIETGDILVHKPNEPLTNLANNSHDIASLQSFGNQWQTLGNQINGISEAMNGMNPPSGTAWRQTQALLNESHSLFELMTENKGLAIEEMMRRFVIPHIKTQLNTSNEIVGLLEANDISKIDAMYIPSEAVKRFNQKTINHVLNGGSKPDIQSELQQVQQEQQAQGAQRFFKPSDISAKTWKEIFKDLEWDLEVDITGENSTSKEDLVTLTTVLQTIASNPRVLYDPNAKLLFNKILEITGAVSPLQMVENPPFVPPPARRFTETLDYKDAPEDIKRQMEAQQGFTPSQGQPTQPQSPTGQQMVGGGLPVTK